MYSGRRIGGSTYTATSTARVAVAACVVVVATAAAVVRIVIVVVGAGIVSTAGVPQPGVRTGWKIGIALIRTRIIAQIRDIVATVQAMVRLAGMQIITHSMIYIGVHDVIWIGAEGVSLANWRRRPTARWILRWTGAAVHV